MQEIVKSGVELCLQNWLGWCLSERVLFPVFVVMIVVEESTGTGNGVIWKLKGALSLY
jgi:hypothetical protein